MMWLFIIYAIIGGVSLFALIVLLVLGGIDLDFGGGDVDIDIGGHDLDVGVHGDGPGPFSIPIILSFTSSFGSMAAVLTWLEVHPVLTPVLAAVGAVIMATLLFYAMQIVFKQFTSDSTVQIGKQIGKKGSVMVPIYPGKEGQIVIFTEQRGRTLLPAVSDKPIKNNEKVVVVGRVGDTMKVVPYAEWKKKHGEGPKKEKTEKWS